MSAPKPAVSARTKRRQLQKELNNLRHQVAVSAQGNRELKKLFDNQHEQIRRFRTELGEYREMFGSTIDARTVHSALALVYGTVCRFADQDAQVAHIARLLHGVWARHGHAQRVSLTGRQVTVLDPSITVNSTTEHTALSPMAVSSDE